ncbi:hypothetical protein B0H17DRAFT_1136416 [Mycena rosella]|uniref:Uncharacterized protein n=1 Tax=Mycena rosella TaxID=1033263 RepID=A0AAD7DBG5_MYCRO|nr:hypothetical protein B0H17DRAFT_1136416 [Mycena rosella]
MFGSHIQTYAQEWVADTWPHGFFPKNSIDILTNRLSLESWTVVPHTHAGKLRWAYVGRNPKPGDRTRSLLLLYKSPHVFPGAHRTHCTRWCPLQGYVSSVTCGLSAIGTEHLAVFSSLRWRQLQLQFFEYVKAISEVKDFIFKSLNQNWPAAPIDKSLYWCTEFSRRSSPSVLGAGDDPMLLTKAISNSWKVLKRVNVALHQRRHAASSASDPRTCAAACQPNAGNEVPDILPIRLLTNVEQDEEQSEEPAYNIHEPGMSFA